MCVGGRRGCGTLEFVRAGASSRGGPLLKREKTKEMMEWAAALGAAVKPHPQSSWSQPDNYKVSQKKGNTQNDSELWKQTYFMNAR